MDSTSSDAVPKPSPAPYQRSLSLTLVCAVAFLAAVQGFAFAYGPDYRKLGTSLGAPWLPTFILVSSLFAIAFLVALWWRMRRWALFGFLAVSAAQSLVFARLGGWELTMLVLPAVVAGAGAWNWARLR
jgi:hypothetical protein